MEVLTVTLNGIKFGLNLNKTPKENISTILTLKMQDSKDNPITKLGKIMGEYAHIAAFVNSNKNILHINPLSANLQNGEISFEITLTEKGFVKLFAQVEA